jgi:ectoine hydroxylase-related dioxygenase (phytanoyl-CoA dioxygenase family)
MSSQARQGDHFLLSEQERTAFQQQGYVQLSGVLSEPEITAIETVFESFRQGKIPVRGRDFCDMAGDYARSPADFAVVNIMLPRVYLPSWQGNLYERRAASIAEQLCGPDMRLDYDQLLAKRPGSLDAVFAWHQDLAYWPLTPDTRTVTCWLAVDDATEENGCLKFIPGSHLEPELRRHAPLHREREKSHTLVAEVDEGRDRVLPMPIRRGDVLAFRERVLHGSGGNRTAASWRRAYVVAFRTADTVARERAIGFTHSHNDPPAALEAVAALRPATTFV